MCNNFTQFMQSFVNKQYIPKCTTTGPLARRREYLYIYTENVYAYIRHIIPCAHTHTTAQFKWCVLSFFLKIYTHCVPKCVSFLFVGISFALVSLALNLFETSYKTVFRNKIVQNGIAEMRQRERTKIIKNRMKN